MKISFAALVSTALLPAALTAQVLMFDFGPTTVIDDAGTANSLVNSPYHTASGFSGTSWNKVQTADLTTGLVYADGTSATGIKINVGASATTSTLTTIALGETPSGNSQLTTGTGIYAGTSVGTDAIFEKSNTSGTNVGSVGVQITGLAAGTYTLYITGRNNNITDFGAQGQIMTAYAAAGTAEADFNFSGYTSATNTFNSSTPSASWVAGANYMELSVSITAGQAINLAMIGGGDAGGTTADQRGFLNSLQIVNTSNIPEPSTYAALFGAGALAFALLRRNLSRN